MVNVPNVRLNNGVDIPQLGFGVFQVPPEDTRDVTLQALEVGYRHIDTAQMYRNEQGVGQALADSGLRRDEVFITSKLNNSFHDGDAAVQAFDRSMQALGIEQLDLFLIHWPLPAVDRYVEAWQALEGLYRARRVRAIGVSNFHQSHVQRLFDETDVGRQPDRGEPVPGAGPAAGLLPRPWHRGRGVVADRPRQGGGRPGDRGGRCRGRAHPGPGDVALARAARRHRVPQVAAGRSDAGELRHLRLRAL